MMNETLGTILQEEFNLKPAKVQKFDIAFDRFVDDEVKSVVHELHRNNEDRCSNPFKRPKGFASAADEAFHHRMMAAYT